MHIRVGEKKFLVSQDVPVDVAPAAGPTNSIFLLDRSGSMAWALDELIEQVYRFMLQRLKPGDTVTIGWFSGEGAFGWAVKAYVINGDNSALKKMLDSLKRSLGTTCFGEILADTNSVIAELSAISSVFELYMLTDGCPVVRNEEHEIEAIFKAIQNLNGKVGVAAFVGYGDYYNKALMADMAQALGGILIHERNLSKLASMERFFDLAKGTRRIPIKLNLPTRTVFTFSQGEVAPQKVNGHEVHILPPEDGKIWMLTDKVKEVDTDIQQALPAGYALAFTLVQGGQYLDAIEVLSQIGDVKLVTEVYNARTNEEYGKAETAILAAANDPQARFIKGRKVGCAPDGHAFSVMDVIDLLLADEAAYLYPSHKAMEYKRIGPKPVYSGDFPKIVTDNGKTPFNKVSWHKSRLNLSVLCRIKGTVALKGDDLKGLPAVFPAYRWANRSILSDGFLNIKRLPVSVGDVTQQALIKAQVPMDHDGPIIILHLDELPIINQAFVAGHTSLARLFAEKLDSLALEALLKVLNWKRNELDPEGETKKPVSPYTMEQQGVLAANGIEADGQYNPPTQKAEPTDFYTATEMEIAVKGYSSLPPVDKVVNKRLVGTKLTPSENLLVVHGLELLPDMTKLTRLEALQWLDATIKDRKRLLEGIRHRMAKTKLGVTLGKQMWDEFKNRADEYVLPVNGVECALKVKPVEIKF